MDDLLDFTDCVAVITGGSRGLGLEMARAFALRGAHLVIASRKLVACEAAAAEIRAMGRRAIAVSINASNWDDMDRLADAAYAEFGRVDVLINNAGMSPACPSPDVTEALFDKIVSLNFKGPFRLSAVVGARMRASDGGAIINISSVASSMPVPEVVPYGGAKAALNSMTVSLAREFGPKVRVNAIAAGPFLTDISAAWDQEKRESAPNSLKRPGRPEEIVTTALYLASRSSSFTTGAIIRCDGGY